jgi:hypothetical protein
MFIACWTTKATHTLSLYVLRIALQLQQWLQESASMLRYTYIACLHNTLLLQYQERCFGTCMSLYFGFPEDGALALKHVGILCVVYDF